MTKIEEKNIRGVKNRKTNINGDKNRRTNVGQNSCVGARGWTYGSMQSLYVSTSGLRKLLNMEDICENFGG